MNNCLIHGQAAVDRRIGACHKAAVITGKEDTQGIDGFVFWSVLFHGEKNEPGKSTERFKTLELLQDVLCNSCHWGSAVFHCNRL